MVLGAVGPRKHRLKTPPPPIYSGPALMALRSF